MTDETRSEARNHAVAAGDVGGSIFNIHVEETQVLESAPKTPPHIPHLHRLIGREAEKQALIEQYRQIKRDRRGSAVFLLGASGSGRHALTSRMQRHALDQNDAVAAARFWDPDLLPEGRARDLYWDSPAMNAYGEALTDAFQVTSEELAGAPWVNLMSQMMEQAKMSLDLPDWPDDPRSLNRFVRRTALRKPLLLTLEHLEWADSMWIDLMRYLVDEAAQDLPVLLLITLAAPAPLDRLTDEQHTEATRLVETLVAQGIATANYLAPITTSQFIDHVSPIEPQLSDQLRRLADDDPLVTEMLWEEWLAHQVVVHVDGEWRINPARDVEWWVFGETRDHARTFLKACLKRRPDEEPPFEFEEIERFLNCAAVEGSTFTAPAVAQVMGVDPDDLIDLFDDYLRMEGEEEGILVDMGFADGPHPICVYRFARPYLHHVWAKYPGQSAQRRRWNRQLADALERLYHPETWRIASKLIDLFEAGNAPQRAQVYDRRRSRRASLAVLYWHVQFLMEAVADHDRFGTYRLFDRGFELSGRLVKERPDLWEDGVWFAQELARRAERLGDEKRQADAWYYRAWHYYNAGHYEEARSWASQAVALYEVCRGPDHTDTAHVLRVLGGVLQAQGNLAGAREACERALRIDEAAYGPDHPGVAADVNNLGKVLRDQGDLAGAREAIERALRIGETIYGPDHPNVAIGVNNLGEVLWAQGNLAGARAAYERALRIDEAAYGPDHPTVARDVNNLGRVLQDQGDLAGARAAFERALRILRLTYGDEHPQVATAHNNLGLVLKAQGDLAGARAAYARALRIDEAVYGPDHPNVAIEVNNLGKVLKDQGDLAGAREACERALRIDEAVYGPDHPTVAIRINNLGSVLQDQGDLAGARAAYARALRILEQSLPPDHPHIAGVRGNLASLEDEG
jgi:tetratricopeptide (TPR) repeat protein